MSAHASVEQLSLYLDAELAAPARRGLEEHLAECPHCRHRLAGLRRVVAGLDELTPGGAPPALAGRVERAILGEHRRRSPLREAQARLARLGALPAWVHVFAVVIALAAIVFLYAEAVGERTATRLVVPAGRVRAAGPRPAVEPLAASGRQRMVGGVFRRRGDLWVEEGLAGRTPDRTVRLARSLGVASGDPEVLALARLEAGVRLRIGTEVVEVRFVDDG